ncbi:MAG: copper resistance protein [Bradyrhizobium sp.]|jgi:putative copper resistance protein D|nr:copper resistance protein [Bradyrhizobium sp.]
MDWFGAGINGPLIVIRAIHFGATAVTAGALIFHVIVTRPALHSPAIAKLLRRQTLWVAWVSLAIAVASGVVWLLFQAASMSGLPLREALTPGILLTVLNETQFGWVSEIRTGLAIVLAAGLALNRFAPANWLALAAALGLIAAIAWTGHAGSTPGAIGDLHLAADALHLCAAAGWIGGLVPLALLLAAASRQQEVAWASLARDAARRFSTLGIVSVATLTATGTLNAWILVGSFHALVVTDYGQLLMLKIAVFAVMLVFAAVNRFWLTPQLAFAPGCAAQLKALGQLTRNSTIEIVLGFIIFAIVGLLGTLHPAIHLL